MCFDPIGIPVEKVVPKTQDVETKNGKYNGKYSPFHLQIFLADWVGQQADMIKFHHSLYREAFYEHAHSQ